MRRRSFDPHTVLVACLALASPALAAAPPPPLIYTTARPPAPAAGNPSLHVINGVTGNEVAVIDLGPAPAGSEPPFVAVSPDRQTAFVTNGADLVVIDTLTLAIRERVTIASGLGALALSPDGSRLYVARPVPQEIRVVDTSTLAADGAPIALSARPSRLAVAPDHGRVYVLEPEASRITVIAIPSRMATLTFATPASPREILLGAGGARLYVAHSTLATETGDGDSLTAYDLASGALLSTLALPDF